MGHAALFRQFPNHTEQIDCSLFRAFLFESVHTQLRSQFAYNDVFLKQGVKIVFQKDIRLFLLLRGTERIGKIRSGFPYFRCCAFGLAASGAKHGNGLLCIGKAFHRIFSVLQNLIIIRIQADIHRQSLHNFPIGCHRVDQPGVDLVGVHKNGSVQFFERIAGV